MEVIEPKKPQAIIDAEAVVNFPRKKRGPYTQGIRRKKMMRELREGVTQQVDRAWLLAELIQMYYSTTTRGGDKLRALELIARVNGYGGKSQEEPEDERKAIQDLIKDMEHDDV